MKAFKVNVSDCIGCYSCQIACKDEHCSNDWTPYAKPQPETGQFWGKIHETTRGKTPHVRVSYVWVPCQHCKDAPCIEACKYDAIIRRDDGLVIIEPKKCTGCQNCINDDACPYGVIFFNWGLYIAQKCTGCAHLLDRGWPINEPRCVENCPVDTLLFGEEQDLDLTGTEILHPEYGTNPRVFYKNLPKKFIRGCVYTSNNEEVVIGATCTLTGEGSTFTQETNDWGDFWFDGLKDDGVYELKIDGAGKTKTISNISTAIDVGLGEIAIDK